ncbi:hypothetical protein H6A03_09410 [[Clostridium] spiroforme]|nr:hypothetical protein [Thomasclavelia spiroformis]MBM6880885.1 hypothetical protein [Thomasclavelia spiroformis]MBM6931517.1 hypothetical protein [Thomasclavelia spiroformis]
MKKIIVCFLVVMALITFTGCQDRSSHEWKQQYQLTYFYVEDCANCQYFTDQVIPAIEAEFGDHMEIVYYDMDTQDNFEEMKQAYDAHIDSIIDFDQDDYGFGPMVFLEGYIAILGAGNADEYVDHLVKAITEEKIDAAHDNETYYYLKDGKIKQ